MPSSTASAAAQMLSQARHRRDPLSALPFALSPQSRDEAYAIQDALVALEGPRIGGWKVAAGTGPEPFCSPLPTTAFFASGTSIDLEQTMTRLIEVEVGVVIATDLPPRTAPYTEADVVAAIGSFHPALEIVASRFIDAKAAPQLDGIADLQHNVAVLVGEGRRDWQALTLDTIPITLKIGGLDMGEPDKRPSTEAVIAAVTWLANHAAARSGGLRAGDLIISGARIVAPAGQPGDLVEAEITGLGTVGCLLT